MKCKLGDYIRIKHGFAFKGEYITAENNGVVLVTPGNFEIGGGFKEDKCKFFNGDYPKEYVLSPYDLIVTMTDLSKQGDTLGYSALVPKTNRVYLHNQRIGLVDVYNPKADKMFIYWLMRTQKYQKTIVQKINSLPLIDKYELSEKIRTNKELASFIISVRNLNKKPHIPMDYGNVILSYANNYEEACNMIEYFKKQGYVFINYSKSNYNYSPYAKYEEDFDTHHVIGQEFDNVLMLMDDSFYYDENGVLQGVPHPNPDYLYPNLFYQGITRVREKIALVIVNSPRLFEKISSIFDIEQEA